MADVRVRARAALLGSLVADAATMPLHWIYEHPELDSLLHERGQAETPEFYNPPANKYYSYELGHLSPYGWVRGPRRRSHRAVGCRPL